MKLNTKYNCRFIFNGIMFFFDDLDVFNLSQLLHFIYEHDIPLDDFYLSVTYSRNDRDVDGDTLEKIFNLRFGDEVL